MKDTKPIRVASYGGPDGHFSLRGATPQELENLEGMIGNRFWVTVNDEGRLEKVNKFSDVPGPVEDEQMMPFWTPAISGQIQLELPLQMLPAHWFIPGLQIQGLGAGGSLTPESYAFQAKLVESLGFRCLRSQREPEGGKFWEIWDLPALDLAKGRLKEVLNDHKHEELTKQLEHCIRYLCTHVQFGSLDVNWQVAALAYD